mgnify:CR=1 FL=1
MSLLSQDGLDRLVAETRQAHAVPGVSVAVVAGDRTLLAADGVQDVATGVPVSTDTAFEIRSVSKLFTAALAMMLHDQGLVGLDDPVAAVLAQGGHGLQAAHGAISLAHLLSHSSGLEADYLAEAEDANAVAAFVERSAALPLLFAAGRTYSYSNIGTVWAGRMVEILTGLSWYQALHQHIAAPLDLPTLGVFPYGSSTTPHIAVGHVVDAAGRWGHVEQGRELGLAAQAATAVAATTMPAMIQTQWRPCLSVPVTKGRRRVRPMRRSMSTSAY